MSIIQFKGTSCKNCYKCIRNCDVGAIRFSEEKARIVEEDCVLCGKCILICPQNAKQLFSDLDDVKALLRSGAKVYASVAPSYVSSFPGVRFDQLSAALKRLGFTGVEETAIGASAVSAELSRLLSEKQIHGNLITTCCPAIDLLVEKYYPELIPQLAPIIAPATAHARMLRSIYGSRAKVVFIGPCIAKKHESQRTGAIHHVLLFDELHAWLQQEGLGLEERDESPTELHNTVSRLFPTPGGIIRTVPRKIRAGYKTVAVDGINRCITILDSLKNHELEGHFIEMSACAGSCMEGPGTHRRRAPFLQSKAVVLQNAARPTQTPKPLTEGVQPDMQLTYSHTRARSPVPDERQLMEIYDAIGKRNPRSRLNCGACGYSTCRQKAVAVFQGKADLHMCLPWLREKAESMSNLILDNTPNAILLVNRALEILVSNRAAQKILSLESDAAGLHLCDVIPAPELEALRDMPAGLKVSQNFVWRDEERGLSLDLTIVSTDHNRDFVLIARDITREEQGRAEIEKIRRETLETTQRVIDKQMRAAQEIASLLGETTGETKAALSRLKTSIMAEDGAL